MRKSKIYKTKAEDSAQDSLNMNEIKHILMEMETEVIKGFRKNSEELRQLRDEMKMNKET